MLGQMKHAYKVPFGKPSNYNKGFGSKNHMRKLADFARDLNPSIRQIGNAIDTAGQVVDTARKVKNVVSKFNSSFEK
jgi:hypothetical protein